MELSLVRIMFCRAAEDRTRSEGRGAFLLLVLLWFGLAPACAMGTEGAAEGGGANHAAVSIRGASQHAQWRALIAQGSGQSRPEMLRMVNDYFNRFTPMEDARHWGRADYWASPGELLDSGAGDCEDFAIAKYFALRDMGVAEGDLRIMYVERVPGRGAASEPHMVLGYLQHDGSPLILDNLTGEIAPLAHRADLRPVYAFNGTGIWLWREGRDPLPLGAPAQLTQWRELLARN